MTMATAVQQRLAASILEEKTLSKGEVERVFVEFKMLVADFVERNDDYKTTDLKALLQDAIESVQCSTPSPAPETAPF